MSEEKTTLEAFDLASEIKKLSDDLSFKDISDEIKFATQNASPEEKALFAKLVKDNDEQAFNKAMAKIHNIDTQQPSENSSQEIPDTSKGLEPYFEHEVVKAVFYHFDLNGKALKKEVEEIENQLLGKPEPKKLTARKAKELSKSENPYIRLMVASKGLCEDVLKNDSVSQIRAQVLKMTGAYSEYYREKEKSPLVMRELIRQGIDNDFFEKQSEAGAFFVKVQQEADHIIEIIESGFSLSNDFKEIIDKLEKYPELLKDYPEAESYISMAFENQRPNLNQKEEIDAILNKELCIQDKFVLEEIKIGDDTPLGEIVEIKQDCIVIKGYGAHGECANHKPHELYEFISQSMDR